jgi:hypothetical protein
MVAINRNDDINYKILMDPDQLRMRIFTSKFRLSGESFSHLLIENFIRHYRNNYQNM